MNYIDVIALVNGMDPYRYWITFSVLAFVAALIGALWAGRPLWVRLVELAWQPKPPEAPPKPPPKEVGQSGHRAGSAASLFNNLQGKSPSRKIRGLEVPTHETRYLFH